VIIHDSVYKKLKRVFDKFPKYRLRILLGDLNANVGREDIVKRAEFLSDRMLYLILRGRWRDIIVQNVHAPTDDKWDYIGQRL
jgi:hypothetical protein